MEEFKSWIGERDCNHSRFDGWTYYSEEVKGESEQVLKLEERVKELEKRVRDLDWLKKVIEAGEN